MSEHWVSLADLIDAMRGPLSESELSEFGRLSMAITHALNVARVMPSTLDAHALGLIVDKLMEAEHWSFELLRATQRPRSPPPQ